MAASSAPAATMMASRSTSGMVGMIFMSLAHHAAAQLCTWQVFELYG
jgi:hypothetical protein